MFEGIRLISTCLVTKQTFVRSGSGVDIHVLLQDMLLDKTLIAHTTMVWLLRLCSVVSQNMILNTSFADLLSALVTCLHYVALCHVSYKKVPVVETFVAFWAIVFFRRMAPFLVVPVSAFP